MTTQIKGSLLIPAQRFLSSSLGPDGWQRLLDSVDASSRGVLTSGVLVPVAWYPFSVASQVVGAVDKFPNGDDLLRQMARASLDYGTNAIFKLIFKIGSPHFMIARSDVVWRTYYSAGAMRVPEAKQGSAIGEIVDFADMTPTYEKAVMYSMLAVVEKAGGKAARGEVVDSISRGHVTRLRITWS